jgi:rare lipoprotein A
MMKKKLIGLVTTVVTLSAASFLNTSFARVTAANTRRKINLKPKTIATIILPKIKKDSPENLTKKALQSSQKLKPIRENNALLPFKWRSPSKQIAQAVSNGEASWYGPGFHGRLTANGEVFNQNALTAAHRSLPFGTRVRVINENNGRSVVVRINDRGPFIGGRVIDLSAAAADVLGIKSSGVAPVKLEIIGQ